MAIWSREQVRQVSGLRASAVVDESLIARYGEPVVTEAKSELSKKIINMAQSVGVDLDAQDLVFVVTEPGADIFTRTMMCRWWPNVGGAQLVGGPMDGQIYAVRNVREPLRIPALMGSPWVDRSDSAEATFVDLTLTYTPTGEWNDGQRAWVFKMS